MRHPPQNHHGAPVKAATGLRRRRTVAGVGLAALGVLLYAAWTRTRPALPVLPANPPGAQVMPKFIGAQGCVACHATEVRDWTGSHHDRAMQPASESTVLGDFNDATFTHFGVASTFFRRNGKFMVRTDGPLSDGALGEFEVKYTFGLHPLQQYLVELAGGRIQALDIAWDSRVADEGGQRWYHLHPEDAVRTGDVLHWTGPALNWNFMCAECHSTDLQKEYDAPTDTYRTTWSEINVSCEACHGPASRHVGWAEARAQGRADADPRKGFLTALRAESGAGWQFDGALPTAKRTRPRTSQAEIEACARCHSRREVIADPYTWGRPLADTHRPALLEEDLYFADGQQQDEVYEYGSFLQSRMHASGVTCSDCHEPHAVARAASPDLYCARCHQPEHFAAPSHHRHAPGSPGASCVACHMPTRVYMGVDARRDHSLRVPRPDLTLSIGTPNACADCHADRPAEWATAQVAAWKGGGAGGPSRPLARHYGEAIHAGRTGHPDAERLLTVLALDTTQPAIARATALSLLARCLSPGNFAAIERGMADPDPLVRLGVARLMAALHPDATVRWAAPLLDDPIRSVRIEAAWTLLQASAGGSADVRLRQRAVDEYRAAQEINQDRAEARTNLGALASLTADPVEAERHFAAALAINPQFVPARLGLADAHRQLNQEARAEQVLRDGIALIPANADLHSALGLALVRAGRPDDALEELRRAAELGPESAHFAYVYGVALNSLNRREEALGVLERAHQRHPTDRDLLMALATISRDAGQTQRAIVFAQRLLAIAPADPTARALLAELSGR